MRMLAEVVDAVASGDTHRDTHALEMLAPNGTTIGALAISNDKDGFAEAIAWLTEQMGELARDIWHQTAASWYQQDGPPPQPWPRSTTRCTNCTPA